jgi:hypothetical protein
MSTYRFLLALLALALLFLGAFTVVSVINDASVTNSTEHTRSDMGLLATFAENRQGNATRAPLVGSRHEFESTPEPCVLVEIKGPNGIRAIMCEIPSKIGEY